MKKIIIILSLLAAFTMQAQAQFHDKGYSDLRLGMNMKEVKKITDFTLKDNVAQVNYKGVELELMFFEFDELVLYGVFSQSKNARIEGVSDQLIGKSYKEIKAILGNHLAPFEDYETSYYIYKKDPKSNNMETSCVLEFNEKGVLEKVFAAYNP